SATDRQFMSVAQLNMAALGSLSQDYLHGDAKPADVIDQTKTAELGIANTKPKRRVAREDAGDPARDVRGVRTRDPRRRAPQEPREVHLPRIRARELRARRFVGCKAGFDATRLRRHATALT